MQFETQISEGTTFLQNEKLLQESTHQDVFHCLQEEHQAILSCQQRLQRPFFFYNLDGLKIHARHLQDLAVAHGIDLFYACKANPLSSILQTIHAEGIGIDVAGRGELDQTLRSGTSPHLIVATGPAKSATLLREYLQNGVRLFVIESKNQLEWLNNEAHHLGVRPKVLLRFQLDCSHTSLKGKSSVLGGEKVTAFGADLAHWETVNFPNLNSLDIIGAHVFQWGNILDQNLIIEIWQTTLAQMKQHFAKLNLSLKAMDFGGGLGIPYKEKDPVLSFSKLVAALSQLKKEYHLDHIYLELGRYLVAPSGKYTTPVIDLKKVRGKCLAILEGGINHIARSALTGEYFPVSLERSKQNPQAALSMAKRKHFSLHGPLCTSLDFLGEHSLPEHLSIGDWIIFHQTGAYGMTESMPFFLCHDLPGEAVLKDAKLFIPRPIKSSADWMI